MTPEQIAQCKAEFIQGAWWPALADALSLPVCDSAALVRAFAIVLLTVGLAAFAYKTS